MSVSFYNASKYSHSPALHKLVQFPAGERHIDFHMGAHTTQVAFVQGCDSKDLITLAMWAACCARRKETSILLMPYLPGARMDRGNPLGAKVYADIINSFGCSAVVGVDAHSDVAPALINNFVHVALDSLPYWLKSWRYSCVIAPDIGARKRAESVANVLKIPVVQAQKHRDFATGKLSGFSCEPLPPRSNCLVVDDICDGGGTFLGLAETLKLPKDSLRLWVTHGVFSNDAIKKLSKYYVNIYSTNSFLHSLPNTTDVFDLMLDAARGYLNAQSN